MHNPGNATLSSGDDVEDNNKTNLNALIANDLPVLVFLIFVLALLIAFLPCVLIPLLVAFLLFCTL